MTSRTVVTRAGIAAALRYGQISSSGQSSYGAKLQISRVVIGSTEIPNLDSSVTSIPNIVWDSRNPNDNPLNAAGEVPMSFLQYTVPEGSNSTMEFRVSLDAAAGPFTIKNIGLYARDDSGNDILFSVSEYTPAIEKEAISDLAGGVPMTFFIFVVLTGIDQLFTNDGQSIVHPSPINIQQINPSYATVPAVATIDKIPVSAASDKNIYNVYYVENLSGSATEAVPGLAIKSGNSWNYIKSEIKDTLNSFPVDNSMLDQTALPHENSVVMITSNGKFGLCDGKHDPVGIYQGGRIYVESGLIHFDDPKDILVTGQNVFVPGSIYYACEDGKIDKTRPDYVVNLDGIQTKRSFKLGFALTNNDFLIYSPFTERYATTDTAGLVKLATAATQVDPLDATFAATPKYVTEKIQESQPEDQRAVFNAYLNQWRPTMPYITKVGAVGSNDSNLRVGTFIPVLTATGIKNEWRVKDYDVDWRRGAPDTNGAWTASNAKASGNHAWEAQGIAIPKTMNYTDVGGTEVKLSFDAGISWDAPNETSVDVRIGDYIWTGGTGANSCRVITKINDTTAYNSSPGVITSITTAAGLANPGPSHTYYILKSPHRSTAYFTYIKYYWYTNDQNQPACDFDLVVSYAFSTNNVSHRFDPSAWSDGLDQYATGCMTAFGQIGTKNWGDKVVRNQVINDTLGYYTRYRVGEVITLAAPNIAYDLPNGIASNYGDPPEPGMILADGNATIDSSWDLYKDLGMSGRIPNMRTYNKYITWGSDAVGSNKAGYAMAGTNMPSGLHVAGKVTNGGGLNAVHEYGAVVFARISDAAGSEGIKIAVDGDVIVDGMYERGGSNVEYWRVFWPANSRLEIYGKGAYYNTDSNDIRVAWNQFPPQTVSWIKINRC